MAPALAMRISVLSSLEPTLLCTADPYGIIESLYMNFLLMFSVAALSWLNIISGLELRAQARVDG